MLNAVLKAFVCVFSFAFTAYFSAVILAMVLRPLAGTPRTSNHLAFARAIDFLPLTFGLVAGVCASRTALRLEIQRQRARRER